MRVLVVEDEEPIASAIERGLTKIGYAVDVAYDGAEALEKAGVNAYDVVCLDLNLPRVDGVEVCRKLRADHWVKGRRRSCGRLSATPMSARTCWPSMMMARPRWFGCFSKVVKPLALKRCTQCSALPPLQPTMREAAAAVAPSQSAPMMR